MRMPLLALLALPAALTAACTSNSDVTSDGGNSPEAGPNAPADASNATGAPAPDGAAPFVYFANYADGTPGRAAHLKDETDFVAAAKAGTLPAVSFVKPAASTTSTRTTRT
jgi:hypothetical protein